MANEKQKNYWTNVAGKKWLAMGGAMEARFTAINDAVIAAAALKPGDLVLDIGCGAGMTSMAAADFIKPTGHVRGIDVSEPMLAEAATQAHQMGCKNLDFLLADAQTDHLGLAANALISRFGVMFFEDPVAAFINLRKNTAPNGRMVFAAWAPLDKNEHWLKPFELAKTLVGEGIVRRPHAPGPLAFSDADYVLSILAQSGWNHAKIEEITIDLIGESFESEARIACLMGPSGALFEEKRADAKLLNKAEEMFLKALPSYAKKTIGGQVRLPATINLIKADF